MLEGPGGGNMADEQISREVHGLKKDILRGSVRGLKR